MVLLELAEGGEVLDGEEDAEGGEGDLEHEEGVDFADKGVLGRGLEGLGFGELGGVRGVHLGWSNVL